MHRPEDGQSTYDFPKDAGSRGTCLPSFLVITDLWTPQSQRSALAAAPILPTRPRSCPTGRTGSRALAPGVRGLGRAAGASVLSHSSCSRGPGARPRPVSPDFALVFLNCSGHLRHVRRCRASEESPRASPSFLTDCPGRRCSSFPRLPPSAQGSWACVPATESGLPSRTDASRSAAQPHPGGKSLSVPRATVLSDPQGEGPHTRPLGRARETQKPGLAAPGSRSTPGEAASANSQQPFWDGGSAGRTSVAKETEHRSGANARFSQGHDSSDDER